MKCTKIKFDTPAEASKEIRRIAENGYNKPWKDKTPKRYYKCGFCTGYHITSKMKITTY